MLPHGPVNLSRKGQVAIPKELREQVGLGSGRQVYFAINPQDPGTLVVIPAADLASWVASHHTPAATQRGKRKETTSRGS
jgi:AbrB family looped-hinge helix DNA binding protein